MNKEELVKLWENFTEKNDFKLNNDRHVGIVADGVLNVEEKTGLKMCPCRLSDESKQRNIELLCPCNFKVQTNWQKKGECWCGLFVKR